MRIPRHPTLLRRQIDGRVRQLQARGPLLGASLVRIARTCKSPGCHCQTGAKHVGNYLTYAVEGRTRTVYVPLDLVEEVRTWIEEHRRLKALSREISALSIARVKGHVKARKRRAGRS